MHVCMLANARHALTVAELAEKAVEVHAHVVVDDLPELEVVVVGQCDRATTLQASQRSSLIPWFPYCPVYIRDR